MESVGEALSARGFRVELVAADAEFDTHFANIFAMCERGAVLDRLTSAEKTGSIIVNSPGCNSQYLSPSHGRALRPTQCFGTGQPYRRQQCEQAAAAERSVGQALRFPRDASRAMSCTPHREKGWQEALHGFAKRGIPFVVAQEHVPGDLVKFYGVRNAMAPMDSNWFEWFYHRDKGMLGYSFEVARLRRAAFGAAAALGLEIFGGDAIIQANGEPVIVDINAWPSYARYRDRAAQVIADHLTERFQRQPRVVAAARS